MAKFTKTFENGAIENRLTYKGVDFILTMVPTQSGSISEEEGMDIQIMNAFPHDEDIEDIAELADQLWCADEDEIQGILEQLDDFEGKEGKN